MRGPQFQFDVALGLEPQDILAVFGCQRHLADALAMTAVQTFG